MYFSKVNSNKNNVTLSSVQFSSALINNLSDLSPYAAILEKQFKKGRFPHPLVSKCGCADDFLKKDTKLGINNIEISKSEAGAVIASVTYRLVDGSESIVNLSYDEEAKEFVNSRQDTVASKDLDEYLILKKHNAKAEEALKMVEGGKYKEAIEYLCSKNDDGYGLGKYRVLPDRINDLPGIGLIKQNEYGGGNEYFDRDRVLDVSKELQYTPAQIEIIAKAAVVNAKKLNESFKEATKSIKVETYLISKEKLKNKFR